MPKIKTMSRSTLAKRGQQRRDTPPTPSARRAAIGLAREYEKYFVAPTVTPDSFSVLDLSEGSSFSFNSHT